MADVTRETLWASRLKTARLEAGLSINGAAKRAGVGKSTWQKWELGSVPNAGAAQSAARALNTTVEAIWGPPAAEVA